ncbi:MAG: hypothetical protein GY790_17685 [Bacteroidetes bacterium]|nr:hypothetical protein [Bacteroidota bacterium]
MKNPSLLLAVFASCFAFSCQTADNPMLKTSPAPQPYSYIQAKASVSEVPESPDPLVAWRWEDPKAADPLEIYTLPPVQISSTQPGSFGNLESMALGKEPISVNGIGDIMIDFGQVNAAWLEFDSDDLKGEVEMSISEYNEPAILNAGAQHRFKTLEPVKHGNTYRLELNEELYEGVRYGWIHVRSFESEWHIHDIRLVCQVKPTNYEGSFSSSDSGLTRIWYTGAYGVKLNLLKEFFGAILMERSDRFSWTGDAYTSQSAALVAFGNQGFVLTNLHHTAEQDNGILSYSMYWIQSLKDYYDYSGDTTTLIQYIKNARFKLDRAYTHYGTKPRLGFYGWDERLGAGFENNSCEESQNAYKMLCIDSWLDFASMMESIGRKELASIYRGYAKEKISELRKDKDWYRDFGIHASADAINAGFTTGPEQKAMFETVFKDRLNRVSYSPFNQYFIIHALARMGRYDEAMETIKDCWGGQLEYGATTFFEVFRPSWNLALDYNDAPPNNQCGYTSFCHPWGGGVVNWLSEELLGIKPTLPGFRQFDVMPFPTEGVNQLKGSVPTPHGTIQVKLDMDQGRLQVVVPEGLTARIGVPTLGKKIETMLLDGNIADFKSDSKEGFAVIEGIEAGDHLIEFTHLGEAPVYTEMKMEYPVPTVLEDTLTSGDWGGVYGSEGYILCAYLRDGDTVQDLRNLPAYVSEVKYSKQLGQQWVDGVKDHRAPSPGDSNEYPRNAGAIYTQDPLATLQTMTVDIRMDEGKSHQIALYFLDWDEAGRRVAVEMFDLNSKRLLAPVQVVRDFAGGKYLIYSYDGPVRFRINHVRGPNATLSGIFFD